MDFLYEDEILPELEIRETLTLEQMATFQPHFIAFTEEQLAGYYEQLVPGKHFLDLHYEVVANTYFAIPNAIPTVLASRANSEGLPRELFAIQPRMEYTLRQAALDRYYNPFQIDDNHVPNMALLEDTVSTVEMGLYNTTNVATRVHPYDRVSLPISAYTLYPFPETIYDFIGELPLPTAAPRKMRWTEQVPKDISQWIRQVRPTIQEIIEPLPHALDVHHLSRILWRYGYDWNHCTTKETEDLIASLSSKSYDEPDKEWSPVPLKAFQPHKEYRTLWDASGRAYEMAEAWLRSDRKDRWHDRYTYWLSMIPPSGERGVPPPPHEIGERLRQGQYTMEEVIQLLTMYVDAQNIQRGKQMQEGQKDAEPKEPLRYEYTAPTLRTLRPFTTMYKDITELKEGNDTRTYDGGPKVTTEYQFEELQNEDLAEIATGTITELPTAHDILVATDCSEGAMDVLDSVVDRLLRLQQISHLPIDINDLIMKWKDTILQPSRVAKIKAAIPSLSTTVIERLIGDRLDTALSQIRQLRNPGLVAELEQIYPAIHNAWQTLCDTLWLWMITDVWLTLAESSVEGTLVFMPWDGYGPAIHAWSPYGPPMESNVKQGILPYLLEVIQTLGGPSWTMSSYRDRMREVAEERFGGRLEALEEKWTTKKKQKKEMSKAYQGYLLLKKGIEARKRGEPGDQMRSGFVQSMLYLPGLIKGREKGANAKWVKGCCTVQVDEKYVADLDLKEQMDRLWVLKQKFAQQRWNQIARPRYREFYSNIVSPERSVDERIQWQIPRGDKIVELGEMNRDAMWVPADILQGKEVAYVKMRTILTRIMTNTNANQFITWLGSVERSTVALQFLSHIIAQPGAEPFSENDIAFIQEIKTWIRNIDRIEEEDIQRMMHWGIVTILCLPGQIRGNTVEIPHNVTREIANQRWKLNVATWDKWRKAHEEYTMEEVMSFITEKRELQKNVALSKLNILSITDRELATNAKKLGLLRLINREELLDEEDDMVVPLAIVDREVEPAVRAEPGELRDPTEAGERDEESEEEPDFIYHGADDDYDALDE